MSQGYKAVNIDKREYLSPDSFNCFAGEEGWSCCYDGNSFLNALTALLSGLWHGDRVMYTCDDAWDCDELLNADVHCSLPERVQYLFRGNGNYEPVIIPARDGKVGCAKKRYVINESQGVFYDREKLRTRAWFDRTLDPLLILLGSAWHGYEGNDLVGSWICQTISASNERPEGLKEIFSPFDPNA